MGIVITTIETCRVTGIEETTWETQLTITEIKEAILADDPDLERLADVTTEHVMEWLCDNVTPATSRFIADEVHDRDIASISESPAGTPPENA